MIYGAKEQDRGRVRRDVRRLQPVSGAGVPQPDQVPDLQRWHARGHSEKGSTLGARIPRMQPMAEMSGDASENLLTTIDAFDNGATIASATLSESR